MFTRSFLRGWWSKALRRRVLFTALTGEDRRYLWLTMKVVDKVRSATLGREIVKILCKLRDALKSPFVKRMDTYGVERARKLAAQAVDWGYGKAQRWAYDLGFVRYLTLLDFKAPSGWGL